MAGGVAMSGWKVKCLGCGYEYDLAQCPICGRVSPQTLATPQRPDPVLHPSHYIANNIEMTEVIEAFGLGFHLGNVVKYVLRAGKKGDRLEDLRKAEWYLRREIEREQKARGK